VYQNKTLRKISGSRKDLVHEEFSLIQNKILNDLCKLPIAVEIGRSRRPLQHVAWMGKRRNTYSTWGGRH
jgi:hypothetical protein